MTTEGSQAPPAPGRRGPARERLGPLGWVARAEEALAGVLIGVILLVTLYAVVMRYVFEAPRAWPIEVTQYAMVFVTFVGAGVLAASREWIAVDLFSNRLGDRPLRWWDAALHAVSAAALLTVVVAGLPLVLDGSGTTPVLGVPRSATYAVVLLALLLVAVQEIRFLVLNLRGRSKRYAANHGVHVEGGNDR